MSAALTSCSWETGSTLRPGRGQGLERGGAAGHLGRALDDLELGVGQILERLDLAGVAGRHGDLEAVADEHLRRPRGVLGVGDRLHGGRARGGEHVGRGALGDLLGERGAAAEVELHLHARVGGLEGLAQRRERLGERRRGEHEERLTATALARGRVLVVGAATARCQCQARSERYGEQYPGRPGQTFDHVGSPLAGAPVGRGRGARVRTSRDPADDSPHRSPYYRIFQAESPVTGAPARLVRTLFRYLRKGR